MMSPQRVELQSTEAWRAVRATLRRESRCEQRGGEMIYVLLLAGAAPGTPQITKVSDSVAIL
jgi:hypothetical protein